MLVFSCTPQLESRYRHYPIYKRDEALAIAIARDMHKVVAISNARAKKIHFFDFFLVWINNNNCSTIS